MDCKPYQSGSTLVKSMREKGSGIGNQRIRYCGTIDNIRRTAREKNDTLSPGTMDQLRTISDSESSEEEAWGADGCFTISIGRDDNEPFKVDNKLVLDKQTKLDGKTLIANMHMMGLCKDTVEFQKKRALFLHSSKHHRQVRIGTQQLNMNLLIQFGIETQEEFDRQTVLDARTHRLVVASPVPAAHQRTERQRDTGMKIKWERGERRRMIEMLANMPAFEPVYYFLMLVPDQVYQIMVIAPKTLHAYLTYNMLAKLLDVQHHIRYTKMCMIVNDKRIRNNEMMEIIWDKVGPTDEERCNCRGRCRCRCRFKGTWDKPFQIDL